MKGRSATQLGLLGVMLLVTLGVIAYCYSLARGSDSVASRYSVWVQVPSAQQVVAGSDVRTAGIRVGIVSDSKPEGRFAQLRLKLDGRVTPVYTDATVKPRIKTLAGEGYVDLVQGTPAAGAVPDRGWLPTSAALRTVQLSEILSTLDPATRRLVRRNVEHSAAIFGGRGRQLNELVGATADFVRQAEPVTDLLAEQRPDLQRLVTGTAVTMRALADRTASLRSLVRESRRVVVAVDERNAALGRGLHELPPALDQTRRTVERLSAFSARAEPVLRDLGTGVAALRPSIARLRPASARLRELGSTLVPLNRRAPKLLAALERFSRTTLPALPQLDAVLRQMNPMLRYLAPYSREVASAISNLGAVAKPRDATGRLARLGLVVDTESLSMATPAQRELLEQLRRRKVLSLLQKKEINPHPAPGSLTDLQPGEGRYERVERAPSALKAP